MARCKVYEAMGDYEGTRIKFAEVYEYSDGTAVVYDEFWGGAPSYFGDRPEDRPAFAEAVRYVATRIVEKFDLVFACEL